MSISNFQKTEMSRENIRTTFPAATAILDEFREYFGQDVKLLYAVEGGQSIGVKPVAAKFFITAQQWLKGSELIDYQFRSKK